MFQYGLGNLPANFDDFLTLIENTHDYATRLAFDILDQGYGALLMNL